MPLHLGLWRCPGGRSCPYIAFLGITFCFAGLQKLADPNFFNATNPSSIQAQLMASMRISPLHALLSHLVGVAVPVGIVIALAELAVGLGAILGLWTRVAAVGGMLLAVTLFLTVSFHSSPYYTGADIVFVFAWVPLVLAGSGGVLSLDGVIAARVADEQHVATPVLVPVRFSTIQQVCGHYENDSCRAKGGTRCDVYRCPFLSTDPVRRVDTVTESGFNAIERRKVVLGGAAALAAAVVGGAVAGATAGFGRVVGGTKSPKGNVTLGPPPSPSTASSASRSTTTVPASSTSTTTSRGTPIGLASDVPVGGAARFTDPQSGDPALVLQLTKGRFVAYDAICPHAGCTVGYSSAANLIVCPCHGSEFDPSSGAVVSPPAPHGLSPIQVAVNANGDLVVDG